MAANVTLTYLAAAKPPEQWTIREKKREGYSRGPTVLMKLVLMTKLWKSVCSDRSERHLDRCGVWKRSHPRGSTNRCFSNHLCSWLAQQPIRATDMTTYPEWWKQSTGEQCCQLNGFVAKCSEYLDPSRNLFSKKWLATNPATFSECVSICWQIRADLE